MRWAHRLRTAVIDKKLLLVNFSKHGAAAGAVSGAKHTVSLQPEPALENIYLTPTSH